MMIGYAIELLGVLIMAFTGTSFTTAVIGLVCLGIGGIPHNAGLFAMVADVIDYGEWKTGYRTEGLVNSACSFGYKIGNGIGSALLGMILEIGGYVGDAAVQSASALLSIEVCFVWIPIAVYACGLLIMKFWKLDKEFPQIIADLKARQTK